jgi:hypothetical protein
MTIDPSTAENDPRSVLASTHQLTRHVRRDQRSGWFPLLVFAAVTFVAIPFARYTGSAISAHCAVTGPGQKVCYSPGPTWYWLVAISLAYAAIAVFYVHRARVRGVGSNVRPYVIAGIVLLCLVTAWSLWALADPSIVARDLHVGSAPPADVLARMVSPAGAIGLALILLVWVERSVLLAVVTTVYLLMVATAAGGHNYHSSRPPPPVLHPDPWGFLPHLLILGGVLLAGGVIVALSQPHSTRTARD